MASRVLLISTNRCTIPDRVFPLGLAHLNGALRQAGHETAWYDRLASPEGLEEKLESFRPQFVGISLRNVDSIVNHSSFFAELLEVTAAVRRKANCPIVLGGSGFSIFPERLLALSQADFDIAGEGETAFPALLEALEKGADHRGILWPQAGGGQRT